MADTRSVGESTGAAEPARLRFLPPVSASRSRGGRPLERWGFDGPSGTPRVERSDDSWIRDTAASVPDGAGDDRELCHGNEGSGGATARAAYRRRRER
jgi:hypothetical protein